MVTEHRQTRPQLRSLGYMTDLDVLGDDATIVDRGDYLVITTPSAPTFYWGNFLLFREAPPSGCVDEWEGLFAREVNYNPRIHHKTFGWDDPDGDKGATDEFTARGYDAEQGIVLTAKPADIVAPPKINPDLEISVIQTDEQWNDVIEHQVITRDERHNEVMHRRFVTERTVGRRARIEKGDGAWFGVYLDGQMVGDLGVVMTDGRIRFQQVSTHPDYRRRGICSTMVHHAARYSVDELGANQLVMVADEEYHAAKIYESVGFKPTEKYLGVCWFNDSVHD